MAPNIFQKALRSLMGYRFGTEQSVGIFELLNPPEWDYKKYLAAYGQTGWLYAVCSVRANNIARNVWRLYRTNSQGDRDELDENDKKTAGLFQLLKKPNPFQTRYELFYQHQNYKDLVGESFWVMNFTTKGLPAQIWLAPPAYMNVIPSPTDYISGYQFKRGKTDITFDPSEVIHIMHPNPNNPYRGISPAQALTTDLAISQLGRKYQETLFHNQATPRLAIMYKGDKNSDQRKEYGQSFEEQYGGVRRAGRTLHLFGAEDVKVLSLDAQQTAYIEQCKLTRDDILGAYNTHPAILGIAENVNKANAWAANYQFALQVTTPELTAIREELNEKLCPFFDDYIELDFDNPVSEDEAEQAGILDNHVKSTFMSLEEGRAEADLGDIQPEDHFLLPPGWQVIKGSELLAGTANTQTSIPPNSTPKSSSTTNLRVVFLGFCLILI